MYSEKMYTVDGIKCRFKVGSKLTNGGDTIIKIIEKDNDLYALTDSGHTYTVNQLHSYCIGLLDKHDLRQRTADLENTMYAPKKYKLVVAPYVGNLDDGMFFETEELFFETRAQVYKSYKYACGKRDGYKLVSYEVFNNKI